MLDWLSTKPDQSEALCLHPSEGTDLKSVFLKVSCNRVLVIFLPSLPTTHFKEKKQNKINRGQRFPSRHSFLCFCPFSPPSTPSTPDRIFLLCAFFFSFPFSFVSLPPFLPNPLVVRNYRSAAFQPVIIKHSSYKTQAGFTRPPGSRGVTHKQTLTHMRTFDTDVAAQRSPSPTPDLL